MSFNYTGAAELGRIVNDAHSLLILQADNPDSDSLASALALEQILGDLGKDTYMYCAVDMPSYLRYLSGWDRVSKDLPTKFDASIVVDASTMTLLEKLRESGKQGWVSSKPVAVLDHHEEVKNPISFAKVVINDPKCSSTGELIYRLATELEWPISLTAKEFITTAILGDTQGLSNQLAGPATYRTMAAFLEAGVDRPKLEELRRQYSKMPAEIFRYKAKLIERTEFAVDKAVAYLAVPQEEINDFSPLYNPAALIQGDMLQTEGVGVAIVFKRYGDGKITAAIRCNPGYPIASQLAESLGGGGHMYAGGFKITDGRAFDDVKAACLKKAEELIAKLDK